MHTTEETECRLCVTETERVVEKAVLGVTEGRQLGNTPHATVGAHRVCEQTDGEEYGGKRNKLRSWCVCY